MLGESPRVRGMNYVYASTHSTSFLELAAFEQLGGISRPEAMSQQG
jgi:hypothetical protein